MSDKPWHLPHGRAHVFLAGLVLTVACFVIQNGSRLFAGLVSMGVNFQKVGVGHWVAETDVLKPADGVRYVAAGRPRGLCDLMVNGRVLASTRGVATGLRERFMLDGSFLPNPGTTRLEIRCEPEDGFGSSLMHEAVVTSYRAGVTLELWRAFTEMLLGPLSSLGLLAFLFLSHGARQGPAGDRLHLRLVGFGVVALAYSLSLAYYTRLLLPGGLASILHVVCKMALNATFLSVCAAYARGRRLSYLVHLLFAIVACVVGIMDPGKLDAYYDYGYVLIPLTTGLAALDLLKTPPKGEPDILIRYLAVALFDTQIIDALSVWANVGNYAGPSVLAMTTLMLALLHVREATRSRRVESAVAELASVIHSGKSIPETLADLAAVAFRETHFSRLSTYVDAFSLGLVASPKQVYVRLLERGYRKTTEPDQRVSFAEGRGLKMAAAIDAGAPVLGQGDVDGAYYTNTPLGAHACLNLSDDVPQAGYMARESFEVVKRLHPVLSTLSERLIEYGVRSGLALERLRSKRGDGTWSVEAGAVFADVNDYSLQAERYGAGFSSFVSGAFLPALCRIVRPWAVREFSRGDEVYLVCIPELIEDGSTPAEATLKTVLAIQSFISAEGAGLCAQAGYPPLRMSIGANAGVASVICDAFQVRTAAEMINEASRLKDAAPKGGTLLHRDLIARLRLEDDPRIGEEIPVLVKRTLVFARPLRGERPAA